MPSATTPIAASADRPQAVVSNSTLVVQLFQALYGQAPGNALYTSYLAQANASQIGFANTLLANFASTSDAALAKQVLDNVRITATTVSAAGSYTALLNAVSQIFTSYGPSARGQVILNLTGLLGGLASDATFGVAAAAFNSQTTANLTYATNAANSVSVAVSTSSTTSTSVASSASTASVKCPLSYSAFNSSSKVRLTSTYAWTCATSRTLSANGVPDHDVTDGNFATPISAQVLSLTFPLLPAIVNTAGTGLNKTASGYVLNGVKLDPGTDGTCASTATSTANGAGCVAVGGRDPWTIEAIGGAFSFGTDSSNAHVQPNGQYHYHGMPVGYITRVNNGAAALTLVGFAVDGFPIYARYGYSVASDAGSAIKTVTSSWQKKSAPSSGRPSVSLFPMGTFTQDYEYVAGSGDLDECNGWVGVTPEFPGGIYHYYITDSFPYIQRCVKGSS